MTQPPCPPPSPPPSESTPEGGLHGPRTNLFSGLRSKLAALEQLGPLGSGKKPTTGLLVALITSATLGLLLSIGIQMVFLSFVGAEVLGIVIAPLTEEPSKALFMLVVAFFMWKIIPNRRYGAALGAAAGLGFGVAESIMYIYVLASAGQPAEILLIRVVVTPLMHPLWSAFVGIGVFVLAAERAAHKSFFESLFGLPLLFLLIGMINHAVWNSFALLLPAAGGLMATSYLSIVLDIIIVFPLFAIVIRDFLGGHFNFQRFFEPLQEPSSVYPMIPPPPPPPTSPR